MRRAPRRAHHVCGVVLCALTGVTPLVRPPPDVRYTHAPRPVLFRHDTHFGYARGQCGVCHPAIFPMLRPTHRTSHAAFEAGAQCAVCHDGRDAFSTHDTTACDRCHTPPPAARTAPRDSVPSARAHPGVVVLARSADSPGSVMFRHSTHAQACSACHPPFARRANATRGVMHDARYCGRCHDGTRTFGVEDAERCDRCHREAGGT